MPRYFFNVHDSRDIPDEDGIVFPGPDAAREQAVIAAGEMLKDLDGGVWGVPEWRMVVTDEQGATVGTLSIKGSMGEA
jgi:hypothetical protein